MDKIEESLGMQSVGSVPAHPDDCSRGAVLGRSIYGYLSDVLQELLRRSQVAENSILFGACIVRVAAVDLPARTIGSRVDSEAGNEETWPVDKVNRAVWFFIRQGRSIGLNA